VQHFRSVHHLTELIKNRLRVNFSLTNPQHSLKIPRYSLKIPHYSLNIPSIIPHYSLSENSITWDLLTCMEISLISPSFLPHISLHHHLVLLVILENLALEFVLYASHVACIRCTLIPATLNGNGLPLRGAIEQFSTKVGFYGRC